MYKLQLYILLIDGHCRQFNANRNTQFRVQWRSKLYSVQNSSIVIKPDCENSTAVRQPWGQTPFRLDSSAPHRSGLVWSALFCASLLWPTLVHSALLRQDILSVSAQLRKHSAQWKGKPPSQSHMGAGLYRQRFLPLFPDWFVLMQMRTPNPRSLHLSKRHYSALIGHWRCWRGYSCTAPVGWGKPQSFWLNKVLLVWLNRIPGAPL